MAIVLIIVIIIYSHYSEHKYPYLFMKMKIKTIISFNYIYDPLPLFQYNYYRVFSLTWATSMQIYWNERKRLHKKRVQLPKDWSGTPTWPPFHCFGTRIWRHDVMWKHTVVEIHGKAMTSWYIIKQNVPFALQALLR